MDLADYVQLLRKRWPTVCFVALLAVLSAATASLVLPPTYHARAEVFVSTQATGNPTDLLQASSFTQQRVRSYADIATAPRVLDPVITQLRLDDTARTLAERVSTAVPPETVLIDITVADANPGRAAAVANAISASLAVAVGELEAPQDGSASPVKISTVEQAVVPVAPISPNVPRNVALALLLGTLLGVGVAVVGHTLDTSVRGEADVREVTAAPVLGAITYDAEAPSRPLIVQGDPHSRRAEAFRQLRTSLQFVDVAGDARSFVITSSVTGEGKSTASANLALTLAAAAVRVCLIEGDLRRPKVAEYLGLENGVGLTTTLIGRAQLHEVVQPWGDGTLDVLAAGPVPPNPSELLGSAAMEGVLRKLEASYDVVLIDAPPLLPVTDAAVLCGVAGGAVVVVGSGLVRKDELAKALASLDSVGARVLGVLLNQLPAKGSDAYSYRYYA